MKKVDKKQEKKQRALERKREEILRQKAREEERKRPKQQVLTLEEISHESLPTYIEGLEEILSQLRVGNNNEQLTNLNVGINGIFRIDNNRLAIEKGFVNNMRTMGIVYASESIFKDLKEEFNEKKRIVSALLQTANLSTLPGIVGPVIAMPDTHSGYGFAIGNIAAIDVSNENSIICPGGVGYDINCGISLFKTSLTRSSLSSKEEKNRLASTLFSSVPVGLRDSSATSISFQDLSEVLNDGMGWMVKRGLIQEEDRQNVEEQGQIKGANSESVSARAKKRGVNQLGTVGSGNHYLEVQVVDEIYDEVAAKVLGLEKDMICVMLHCGSRGLGHQVCCDFLMEAESLNRKKDHPTNASTTLQKNKSEKAKSKAERKLKKKTQNTTQHTQDQEEQENETENYDEEVNNENNEDGFPDSPTSTQTDFCELQSNNNNNLPQVHNNPNDRQLCGLLFNSEIGQRYFQAMSAAANYAFVNRSLIGSHVRTIFQQFFNLSEKKLKFELIYDVCHNIAKLEEHEIQLISPNQSDPSEIENQPTTPTPTPTTETETENKNIKVVKKNLLVHRKGATRSFGPGHPDLPEKYKQIGQPVIIGGSMGTHSYVLVGTEKAMKQTFGSTCHGAGRSLSRNEAKRERDSREVLKEMEDKDIVLKCASPKSIAEECSDAYKDVSEVVGVCHNAGISKLVAKLKPVIVIKG